MQCKKDADCHVASLLAMTGILYTALSFAKWRFLHTGDPSVGLMADCSPRRGTKRGCDATIVPVRNLCREALPLLGEVARSAEGVASVAIRAEGKRKSRVKIKISPPLCKGRWFGVSRTERIVQQKPRQAPILGESVINTAGDNPSVSLRLTAPFTQGSQENNFCTLPCLLSNGNFLGLATPQSLARQLP